MVTALGPWRELRNAQNRIPISMPASPVSSAANSMAVSEWSVSSRDVTREVPSCGRKERGEKKEGTKGLVRAVQRPLPGRGALRPCALPPAP